MNFDPLSTTDQITRATIRAETPEELWKELQSFTNKNLGEWLRIYRGSPYSTATKATKIDAIVRSSMFGAQRQ